VRHSITGEDGEIESSFESSSESRDGRESGDRESERCVTFQSTESRSRLVDLAKCGLVELTFSAAEVTRTSG
jgi:hypothetical protein